MIDFHIANDYYVNIKRSSKNSIIITYPEDILYRNIGRESFEYKFENNWMSITDLIKDTTQTYLARNFSHFCILNTHVIIMTNIMRSLAQELLIVFNELNERVPTHELRNFIPKVKKEDVATYDKFNFLSEELLFTGDVLVDEAREAGIEDEFDIVFDMVSNFGEIKNVDIK